MSEDDVGYTFADLERDYDVHTAMDVARAVRDGRITNVNSIAKYLSRDYYLAAVIEKLTETIERKL